MLDDITNLMFAQRRVARLNPTWHAAATAICSRSSRGGGGFEAAAEGRGLGSGSIASWLWSADRVWGALEVLAERSAQPSLGGEVPRQERCACLLLVFQKVLP